MHEILKMAGCSEIYTMVGVAQLVEHRIVVPAVVGSIPIVHPIFKPGRNASR